MKSTFHQVPNMKGKRSIQFRCGCCEAFDKRYDYSEQRAIKEMMDEANQQESKNG